MRRKEKEITEQEKIIAVIQKSQVCRLGLARDDRPYIVPVSFGFDGEAIYFHTARGPGLKLEYMAANDKVCFEFEHNVKIVADDKKPCAWSFSFQSVVGFGRVVELENSQEKIEALTHIMAQYSNKKWDFTEIPLDGLRVWKIHIESMSGKQSLDYAGAH